MDTDSLTLNALKSIAEYVQISWQEVGPLKRELEEAHEVDAEINELEARIEYARKRLNKAKFFRSGGQLDNIIWLI